MWSLFVVHLYGSSYLLLPRYVSLYPLFHWRIEVSAEGHILFGLFLFRIWICLCLSPFLSQLSLRLSQNPSQSFHYGMSCNLTVTRSTLFLYVSYFEHCRNFFDLFCTWLFDLTTKFVHSWQMFNNWAMDKNNYSLISDFLFPATSPSVKVFWFSCSEYSWSHCFSLHKWIIYICLPLHRYPSIFFSRTLQRFVHLCRFTSMIVLIVGALVIGLPPLPCTLFCEILFSVSARTVCILRILFLFAPATAWNWQRWGFHADKNMCMYLSL